MLGLKFSVITALVMMVVVVQATIRPHPFLALINYNVYQRVHTGVLFQMNRVVTVAPMLKLDQVDRYHVVVNRYDRVISEYQEEHTQRFKVKDIAVNGNLAVLKLDRKVDTMMTRFMVLDGAPEVSRDHDLTEVGQPLQILGWGINQWDFRSIYKPAAFDGRVIACDGGASDSSLVRQGSPAPPLFKCAHFPFIDYKMQPDMELGSPLIQVEQRGLRVIGLKLAQHEVEHQLEGVKFVPIRPYYDWIMANASK